MAISHILAIDQGTTSSRAIVFNEKLEIVASAQEEFEQFFPQSGWVEHDPEEIWHTTLSTCKKALQKSGLSAADITAIGITNQRETTLVWDKDTGKAIHKAIVWQDRRTSEYCSRLQAEGHDPMITAKTGLLLDSYFSGTKIKWILDNVAGAREKATKGQLRFGTVDSFLLWRLTGGKEHSTDATNASRTMLYNIHDNCWEKEILELLDIPERSFARSKRLFGRFRADRPGSFRGIDPHRRHRRRPAGGSGRTGLFSAGDDKIDLWHRLFRRA